MVKRFLDWLLRRDSSVETPAPVVLPFVTSKIHVRNYRVDLATEDGVIFVYVNGRMVGGFPDETWAMEAACYRLEQLHHAQASHRPAA